MKRGSQDSWSLTLLRYVNAWRKRDGLSREAAAVTIVEAYRAVGEPPVGSDFRASKDAYEDARINAQRVFRWLDDQTKDCTLLPFNFAPAILAALPPDLCLACVDELLFGLGLSARRVEGGLAGAQVATVLASVAKESGEATASLADLVDGATPAELDRAHREVTEAVAANTEALRLVESMMSQSRAG